MKLTIGFPIKFRLRFKEVAFDPVGPLSLSLPVSWKKGHEKFQRKPCILVLHIFGIISPNAYTFQVNFVVLLRTRFTISRESQASLFYPTSWICDGNCITCLTIHDCFLPHMKLGTQYVHTCNKYVAKSEWSIFVYVLSTQACHVSIKVCQSRIIIWAKKKKRKKWCSYILFRKGKLYDFIKTNRTSNYLVANLCIASVYHITISLFYNLQSGGVISLDPKYGETACQILSFVHRKWN